MWNSAAGFLFVCAFAALLVTAPFGFIANRRFNSRVRIAHPSLWARIGQTADSEFSANSPAARFVTQKEYRDLPDPVLHELGDRTRLLSLLLAVEFAAVVVFGCIASFTQ
jgi:hypothetical protein